MVSDERDAEIEELVRWFKAAGGWLNADICVAFNRSHGFHMQAAKKIDAPFAVATCPLALTFSKLNLENDQQYVPYIDSKLRNLRGSVPDHVLTYLLLIEQLALEEESKWYPYINLLPDQDELTTALWFTAEDNKYLEGTPLLLAARERNDKLRREYEDARTKMRDAGLESSDVWNECDIDTFIWAATIMDSRAFTSKNILPDMPAFPILFPVIDIANHWVTTKARWEYPEHGDKRFTLNILDNLTEGAEIFNNYGPKQNEQLLLAYGFAIPNNAVEQVSLKLAAQDQDRHAYDTEYVPFGMDTGFLHNNAATDVSYLRTPGHILGQYQNDIPFFRGFPPHIVFTAYLQALQIRNIEIEEANQFYQSHVSGRLVLGTLLLLYGAIQMKCVKLPWAYSTIPDTLNAKQRYASIYRDGQSKIWHTMRRELKVALEKLRAREPGDLLKRPVIVTIDQALTVFEDSEYSSYCDQFKESILKLSLNDEEDQWVMLLALFMMITTNTGTILDEWILMDLVPYYPEVDEADIDPEDPEYQKFSKLFEQLKELNCGRLSQTIRECPKLPHIITWATRVAYCELFCLPDSNDPTLARHCMYFQPLRGKLQDSREDWMFQHMDIFEQEPEGTPDLRIFHGKFGH